MQLIGMLNSPYVRRVAIALNHYNLPFEHRPLSVFRDVEAFSQVNPLIKAPSFVCDDGEVLMDSTLILTYLQKITQTAADSEAPTNLMPQQIDSCRKTLRLLGLGLNACDKTVQVVYERELRPVDKQHQPWLDRVQSQVLAAYDLIESAISDKKSRWLVGDELTHADIIVSVAWQFTQYMIPNVVPRDRYPITLAFSSQAEELPAFAAAPMDKSWRPTV